MSHGLDLEKLVSEFFTPASQPSPHDPFIIQQEKKSKYKNFGNVGSILVEEAFFLYSLVRMVKPQLVLDCGTYLGVSTIFLAQALRDNGFGRIVTVECNASNYQASQRVFDRLLFSEIESHYCYLKEFFPPYSIDFLFLDTETAERVEQFHQLYPYLADESWVVFHDAGACKGIEEINHPFLHFDTVREMRVYHVIQDRPDERDFDP